MDLASKVLVSARPACLVIPVRMPGPISVDSLCS